MASAQGANTNMSMNLQISAAQFNETRREITELVLSQQKTLRSMHIVLGVFSLIFATVMVARILYDSWRAAKLKVVLRPKKLEWLRSIHTAEVFPLALATGLTVQMIIIIAVQSGNLDRFFEHNCRAVVQLILPTILLVGYVNLVFGIETTIRAFKGSVPRGKWNVTGCTLAILGCLLVSWIPTIVWPGKNLCFGELIWIPFQYRRVLVPLLSVLLSAYIALGSLLTLKLRYDPNFDADERVSASRMVWYLTFALVEHALIVPFFIQAYMMNFDEKFTSSRVAEIALFSSGIFVAFLHLFLRVNVNRMIIKPVGVPWKQNTKAIRFRLFGPSDLEMNISKPLGVKDRAYAMQEYYYNKPEKGSYDYSLNSPEMFRRPSDPEATYTPQLPTILVNRDFRQSNGSKLSAWPLPLEPLKRTTIGSRHSRKPSGDKRTPTYSLFPNRASIDDAPRLPATIYNPFQPSSARDSRKPSFDTGKRGTQASLAPSVTDVSEAYRGLLPPMPPFARPRSHRRDSSLDSSATVQIGLRLSVAPAALMGGSGSNSISRQLAPPSPLRESTGSTGESIAAAAPAPLFSSKPLGHKRQPSAGTLGPSGPPPSAPPPSAPSPVSIAQTEEREAKKEALPAMLAAPYSPASTRFQEDDESIDGSSEYSAPSFKSFTILNPQNSQRYLESARNKVLPPTPRESITESERSRNTETPVGAGSPPRVNATSTPERTASPRWVDLRSGTIKRNNSPARNGMPEAPAQKWI
ncbi:hypothetical protein DIS24_g2306 [Lasiodiplodia hormozganensis]|uniref:Uncharacterized protein n=1 Tax=Lasiodiplodia hormozganensis TaxID=869390 RepID=A0AA39Z027_9PEZI|nr:hypothetical protein DIS24_g2306 [Lasiodiplodia hormozganensis]